MAPPTGSIGESPPTGGIDGSLLTGNIGDSPSAASDDSSPSAASIGNLPPRFHLIASDPLEGRTRTRDMLLQFIVNNKQYFFNNFQKHQHPEADIRARHLRLRAIRANYVNHWIQELERAWDAFQNDIDEGLMPENVDTLQRFQNLMLHIDEALRWDSVNREDDARAAKAPPVDPYFMNRVVRKHVNENNAFLASNTESSSYYGSIGSAISGEFSALRGSPSDPIRRILLDRVTNPFDKCIIKPLERLYAALHGRAPHTRDRKLAGQTLDKIVTSVETLIIVGCVGGSVALVNIVQSTTSRLIMAFFASIICVVPAAFLSEVAKSHSVLIAGVWAVLTVIVFVSDERVNPKSG